MKKFLLALCLLMGHAALYAATDLLSTPSAHGSDFVTVTFNANGGTGGATITQMPGSKLEAPIVARPGHIFVGWNPEVPKVVPLEARTYTAKWKKFEGEWADIGFVRGKSNSNSYVFIDEFYTNNPSLEDELGRCTVIGLPKGITFKQRDYPDDLEFSISGKTSVPVGDYPVLFQFEDSSYISAKIKVRDPLPSFTATYKSTTKEVPVGWDYGCYWPMETKANVDVEYQVVNGELKKIKYKSSYSDNEYGYWNREYEISDTKYRAVITRDGKEAIAMAGRYDYPTRGGVEYETLYATILFWDDNTVTGGVGYDYEDARGNIYIIEGHGNWGGAPIEVECTSYFGVENIGSGSGKITHSGMVALGNSVTLKATADKGSLFAGWYSDSEGRRPLKAAVDYRTTSLSHTITNAFEKVYAKFVTAEKDHLLTLTVKGKEITDGSHTFMVYGPSVLTFDVGSNSLPKVSVKGLPAGLKFTAKPVMKKGSKTEVEYPANSIYGVPTKPGIYTVTVSLTNTTVKKAVTKTFNLHVPNLTAPGVIDIDDRYGEYVPGVSYTKTIPGAEGCTVSGLPAGMKWTAKDIYKKGSKTEIETPANSVYGIPTTPGNYTVYFTKTVDKVKHTATATFKVGPYPQLTVEVPVCTDGTIGGKVTGTGGFAANKKVTLKATPNKGYVFAGWYEDATFETPCDSTLVDYRNPSYTYVMGATNKTFYARFVPAEEDHLLTLTVKGKKITDGSHTFMVDGLSVLTFDVGSNSLPKVSVKGLPAGMKFTTKPVMKKGSKTEVEYPANTIYGTPTKPGIYTVTVSLTNTTVKKAVTKTFEIEVPNLTAANEYFNVTLQNGSGDTCQLVAGDANVSSLPSLTLRDPNCKLAVSGLPSGLKYDAKTGQIVGVPTKTGTFTVTLTVTEGKQKFVSTITIKVTTLPSWAIGTFGGELENQWLEDDGPAYAYGDAYLEIDDEGHVFGQIELWDDDSYTYSDIATKATVKILADGCCLLKIPADVYTEMIDEGYTYHEGRYTLEATIDKTGYLSLDYGRRDYGEFLHGDLSQWGDSLPSWVTGTYICDELENGWWCEDCEEWEYAYGYGRFEIDALGNVGGEIHLWDDSSYTYADINSKATVNFVDDMCMLRFTVIVYTDDYEEERTYCEGRFTFEAMVSKDGVLTVSLGSEEELLNGDFLKE